MHTTVSNFITFVAHNLKVSNVSRVFNSKRTKTFHIKFQVCSQYLSIQHFTRLIPMLSLVITIKPESK